MRIFNSNGFWQALKKKQAFKITRIIWNLMLRLIKLGILLYKILEIFDKHSDS